MHSFKAGGGRGAGGGVHGYAHARRDSFQNNHSGQH